MNTLKKIWKDQVGSKIIAAILIGIGSIILTSINSILQNIEFKTAFRNFWTFKIELWIVIICALVLLITLQLIKTFKSKAFSYDEETLKLDRKLFDKIRNELLPQNKTIYFLRHNNFAGFSFDLDKLDDLYNIEHENINSDFEFLNPQLEEIKKLLLQHISHFTTTIACQTFPTSTGRQSVPEDWELDQPERFDRVVKDLHKSGHEICDKYDELIKIGRRVLKI